MKITTLQITPEGEYSKNLKTILKLLKENRASDFVLSPEVSLTDFDYQNFEVAANFSKKAEEIFKTEDFPTFAITLIEKIGDEFFNTFKVFKNREVIYSQSKYKLFLLGDEHNYFTAGKKESIKKFEIDGVKFGCLICFELRFTDLWRQLEGVDILLIPAAWGKLRKEHLEKLSAALAIANRCFVVVSDLGGENYAKGSGIITPFGEEFRDDRKIAITKEISLTEIKKMKRYIPYEI